MHRRVFLTSLLGASFAATAQDPSSTSTERTAGHFVPARALQKAVDQRFPLRYPVAGLMDLELHSPGLRLLPDQNRVAAELGLKAAGLALNRSHSGTLAFDFGLRYEAGDRSLRAHQLKLGRLQLPSLQLRVVEMLNQYAPVLVADSLKEVVLHQFSDEDLSMLTRLGLQPGPITVTSDGLVVSMVPRPL